MFSKLKGFVTSKSILIVGNAQSALNKSREIDTNFDIIVRINLGYPENKEEFIGYRTDIWATSYEIDLETVNKKIAPKFILWMTPKNQDKMSAFYKKNAILYPNDMWLRLKYLLKARPSTGCMVIDMLHHLNPNITLLGFDFWKTKSWMRQVKYTGPHNPSAEKEYVKSLKLKELK